MHSSKNKPAPGYLRKLPATLLGVPVLFAIIATAFSACESADPICYEPANIVTNIRFVKKTITDTTIIDSTVPEGQRDSVIITYNDTLMRSARAYLLNASVPLQITATPSSSLISVFLDPDSMHATYAIQFDTTIQQYDTMEIYYNSYLHFISNTCGYTYYYTIDSVSTTSNIADSVIIFNTEVNNDASRRHIGLYFFQQ